MKEDYIKQVQKELYLTRAHTKEVLRDLDEAFESAAQHGESVESVIARLGTPHEYAGAVNEQFASEVLKRHVRRKAFTLLIALAAVLCVCIFMYAQQQRSADGVIGQADAATQIFVGGGTVDPVWLFLAVGILLAIVALLLWRKLK